MSIRDDSCGASKLSKRQIEIAGLISRGLSNPDIAAELFVSTSTVKKHVSAIMEKLQMHHRSQIAHWYGVAPPPQKTENNDRDG